MLTPSHRARLQHVMALAAILLFGWGHAAERTIYPDPAAAETDLEQALKTAAADHRRVIVDFGGNWCPDCQVLEIYFHDSANRPLLDAHYVLVHVNIGERMEKNSDLAAKLHIPLRKGVPALAVLDSDGTLLYSQQTGEFEAMRRINSGAVTQFLVQWTPKVI